MKPEIQGFLKKYHATTIADDGEIRTEVEHFLKEANAGLSRGASSLSMIPTYICIGANRLPEEKVLVIDAGGTNLRIALTHWEDGHCVVEKLDKYPMMGIDAAITMDEYNDRLAAYTEPYLDEVMKLSYIFSFPSEITPDLDGRVLRFAKEVKISGAEGTLVAQGLQDAIRRRRPADPAMRQIVVLNDTVSTLLGGLTGPEEETVPTGETVPAERDGSGERDGDCG